MKPDDLFEFVSYFFEDVSVDDFSGFIDLDNYYSIDEPSLADEGYGWNCGLCNSGHQAIDSEFTEGDATNDAETHLFKDHFFEILKKELKEALQ